MGAHRPAIPRHDPASRHGRRVGTAGSGALPGRAAAATAWCDIALTLSLSKAAIDAGGGLPAEMLYAYTLTNGNQGPEAEEALAVLLAKPDLADDQRTADVHARGQPPLGARKRPLEAEAILAEAVAGVAPGEEPTILTALRGAPAAYRARPTMRCASPPKFSWIPRSSACPTSSRRWDGPSAWVRPGATPRSTVTGNGAHRRGNQCPGAIRYSLLTLELQAAAIAGDLAVADEIAATYSTEASDLPGFARTLTTYMRGYAAYFRGDITEAADCIRGVVTGSPRTPRNRRLGVRLPEPPGNAVRTGR